MEDIRMMLDRRPFESYWFFTWCISGPIITLVSKKKKFVFLIIQIVFFSSIIQFRAPTEGSYVYLPYANGIGWLMVCSSIIFIPGIMIYEFIKAWKATKHYQNQVNEFLLEDLLLNFVLKIANDMPHYLRMLTYASQPADDWGPARKENRYGRYEIMNRKLDNRSTNFNENINNAFDSQTDICSRL